MEACILNHLKAFGLPEVKNFGTNNDYNILIMELVGHSLENLFQSQNRKFSLKTSLMLGIFIVILNPITSQWVVEKIHIYYMY